LACHYLKTWPGYFAAVVRGDKSFELRKADRDFTVGDSLILQEFLPSTEVFTGRNWVVIVTYRLDGGMFGLDEKYCVLGIRQLSIDELGSEPNVGGVAGSEAPPTGTMPKLPPAEKFLDQAVGVYGMNEDDAAALYSWQLRQ
jgi:hypothetical protein